MEACLEITTNAGCYISCEYCPQEKFIRAFYQRGVNRLMGLDVFKRCINKLPKGIGIHFSGMSEPWLNPECADMMLYAASLGFETQVFTTTIGMSLGDVDKIKRIKFSKFRVHLPSSDGRMKDYIDENYLKVINKLMESNVSNIGFKVFGLTHPALKKILKHSYIEKDKAHSRAGNLTDIYSLRLSDIIRCRRGLKSNVLLPNGDVVLCCQDYELRHILGNLNLSDYESLFQAEEFKRIKKELADPLSKIMCRYCIYAERVPQGVLGEIAHSIYQLQRIKINPLRRVNIVKNFLKSIIRHK